MKMGIIRAVVVVEGCIAAMKMAVSVLDTNLFEYGEDGAFMGRMFAFNDAVVVVAIGCADNAWNEVSTAVVAVVVVIAGAVKKAKRIRVSCCDWFMLS